AGVTTKLDHIVDSGVHPEAHGRTIFRIRECLACGDWPLVAVLRTLRSPFTENSSRPADHDRAIIERGILHHRARENSILKGGCENKRCHHRTSWMPRLKREVVLVQLTIAS